MPYINKQSICFFLSKEVETSRAPTKSTFNKGRVLVEKFLDILPETSSDKIKKNFIEKKKGLLTWAFQA